MKWLIFLFIPLISFSQVTYEDMLSINSLDQFKRVMIENDYEFIEKNEKETLTYAMYPTKNDKGEIESTDWAYFSPEYNSYIFRFVNSLWGSFTYDDIYDIVKEKCKFSEILDTKDDDDKPIDYACYTCPESSVGKIGFTKDDGVGVIINF
jgi:hypothetical protein